jgi:hypothetical protein
MKIKTLASGGLALSLLGFAFCAQAQVVVSDNAGNYYNETPNSPNNWGTQSGATSSTTPASPETVGITDWTFSNTVNNGNTNGTLLESSATLGAGQLNINSGGSTGHSWTLYANGGGEALAMATFSGSMAAGQTLTVDMANNFVANGGNVGLNLMSSGGTTLYDFQFQGGATHYTNVWDTASGYLGAITTLAYTTNGLQIAATEGAGNALTITITEQSSQGVFAGASWSTNFVTTATIGKIQFFDNNGAGNPGGGDAYNVAFNNLVVPEPSTLALVGFSGLMAALIARRRK